ncbi:OLC1v1010370C1 [Oldenlandia corymbosa var. corymbosa]|uniref:OLC1v1010370C1 n=1 Tax=Oldenlandia corymbosa var. corymbosa TaxID=529605 RepID=A0AAV1DTK4_OLDCO|nr:OLC1v1010370C1 [Oldenlandia corymbosa var. corymbosa]
MAKKTPMIKEAIATLKERTGSSVPAIAKFVEDKEGKNLPPNFKKLLFKLLNQNLLNSVVSNINVCKTSQIIKPIT